MKTCACGRCYSAEEWGELHYVGVQDDGVERIEMRSCHCGSTLAVSLGPSTQSPPEAT